MTSISRTLTYTASPSAVCSKKITKINQVTVTVTRTASRLISISKQVGITFRGWGRHA